MNKPDLQDEAIAHSAMVAGLVKDPEAIRETLDSQKVNLIHMAMGVSGEAGELLDAVKKHTVYNKPLDSKNVIEELGDLEFYMEGLRQELGITRDETLEFNIGKLGARYLNHRYSDEQAQARADKQAVS